MESLYVNLATGNCTIDKFGCNSKRALILFDDIDGLGESDNGIISALVEIIPKIRHPIVITAESVNISKMKKLLKACYDLRLKAPNKQQVAKFLFRIVKHENLTADGNALEEIVDRSSHDIRASIINLQLHSTLTNSLKLENLALNCFKSTKNGLISLRYCFSIPKRLDLRHNSNERKDGCVTRQSAVVAKYNI